MILIKRWICMLVLMLIVTTTNVNAVKYEADDNYSMPSQYHYIFNNYFDDSTSYKYFSYKCTVNGRKRNCYYGIDNNNNYLKISYVEIDNNYVVNYEKGIDEDFEVIGSNVFEKNINPVHTTNYAITFFSLLVLLLYLVFKYV